MSTDNFISLGVGRYTAAAAADGDDGDDDQKFIEKNPNIYQ